MLKFVIARPKDNDVYDDYIGKSLKMIDCGSYEIFDEDHENLSLTKKYNLGIDKAIEDGLNDDDILIFCHNDVEIIDNDFKEKVDMVFGVKQNIGLLGVIGCKQLGDNGMWWASPPINLLGHIIQEYKDKKENHLVKGSIGYSDNIIAVDGLILMIRGKILNDGLRFDENFNFNMYDIDMCFNILFNTEFKIAIADILVKHKSEGIGSLTNEWREEKEKMINKYKKIGIAFPVTSNSLKDMNRSDELYN